MDRASQVLADGLPESQPCTYRALARHGEIAYATVWHRAHGRRSKEEKARRQQYLTPAEEKALAQYLKRMADLGYPIPIKHLRSLAFSIARGRSAANVAIKPPGKNWPKAFETRHPELKARKVKAVDWNYHDNNIYGEGYPLV
jgi:Tc5 transposase-like DNA-binding protein